MKRKLLYTLAALALAAALPAEATWTYVASPGKYNGGNDKAFSGVITDKQTWTFYVLDLGDGTWQLGAGTWGVDQNFGSFLAGKSDSVTPIPYDGSNYTGTGSGVLDLSTLAKDTGLSFSAVGPRFMGGHTGVTSIILPPGVKSIGIAAFQGCTALTRFDASLTSLETIADATNAGNPVHRGALQNCTSLTNIVLPATLTYVGNNAFTYLKSGSVPQIHFQGDVPTFNGNVFNGNKDSRWAFYVNALQYPNWKNAFATGLYSTDAVFPHYDGEKTDWLPSYLNDSAIYGDPSVFFGYKTGVPPFVNTSERAYLIQEGKAGETTPASSAVSVSDIGRTNATFSVTVYPGTSSSAELTFTVGNHTETATALAETTYTYTYYDLNLETVYKYTAAVTAESGNGTTTGEMTTIGPDVKLGATSYSQTDDGLSATLTVNVSQLLAGTADVVLSLGGSDVETKTVSAAGDVSFDVSGLTLDQEYTYTFTATSSANADIATATVTFTTCAYHWEYTPNGREKQTYPWNGVAPQPGNLIKPTGGQPYHGLLSDGYWTFYVYHHGDDADGEFWLGKGDAGSTAYSVAGRPALDLTKVYADTGIKLVRMGGYAFKEKDASVLRSIVLPKYMRHIVAQAFYKATGLTEIDLSNTQVTNIEEMAFQNCTSMTNVVLPATLQKLGGTAFAWGPAKRAIHFLGDVPVCEPSVSSGTKGSDQAIYSGADNRQWAYCVDAEKYPNWKSVASTLYTTENSFPAATEANWVPEAVRKGKTYANGKKTYDYPFGNSTLGRSYDSSPSGRAYLIQETQIKPGLAIIIR